MHPVVARVTARIVERSAETRSAYLAHVHTMIARQPPQDRMGCANLAHAYAALPGAEKFKVTVEKAPNIGVVTAYNDMLSAHQPFRDVPEVLKKSIVGLTFIRDSDIRSDYFTQNASKYGGLVEFYRSPARVAWTPTGTNVPDYPKLAQLWWKNVAQAVTGEKTPQAAMDNLADEMDQVIGQFLDFARGEDEKDEAVDLDALVRDVLEHYALLGRDVALIGEPQAGTWRLRRLSVRRAIINLVDNALRHAGEPVHIVAARANDHARIDVLDRGPGIPAHEAERLKRPFTRLSEARSGSGGAGLGLAIVERIARAHGGSLDLAEREGGGLMARLILRRAS